MIYSAVSKTAPDTPGLFIYIIWTSKIYQNIQTGSNLMHINNIWFNLDNVILGGINCKLLPILHNLWQIQAVAECLDSSRLSRQLKTVNTTAAQS